MFSGLTGLHAIIIVGVIVLIFGATKLPALARGVAQSVKVLQTELKSNPADAGAADSSAAQEAAASRIDPRP
jgi:sec-independent protein translocase protein TatA